MPDSNSQLQSQNLFASAISFREGAQALLPFGDQYADSVAMLCHLSAVRMMHAYITQNDLPVGPDEDMAADLWNICASHHEKLDATESEAQTLLDCEWDDYPRNAGAAQAAVESAIRLEQAILEISPELMMEQDHSMSMDLRM